MNGERRPANIRQSCRRIGRTLKLEQVGGLPCKPFQCQYRELKTYSTVLLTGGGLQVPRFSQDKGVMWHSMATRDAYDGYRNEQRQSSWIDKWKPHINLKRKAARKAARTAKQDKLDFLQIEEKKFVQKQKADEERAKRVVVRTKNKNF